MGCKALEFQAKFCLKFKAGFDEEPLGNPSGK